MWIVVAPKQIIVRLKSPLNPSNQPAACARVLMDFILEPLPRTIVQQGSGHPGLVTLLVVPANLRQYDSGGINSTSTAAG
jgi:hypothetical protein